MIVGATVQVQGIGISNRVSNLSAKLWARANLTAPGNSGVHTSQQHKTVVSTPHKSLREPKKISRALCARKNPHRIRRCYTLLYILILHLMRSHIRYAIQYNTVYRVYTCTVYTKHCVSPSHHIYPTRNPLLHWSPLHPCAPPPRPM